MKYRVYVAAFSVAVLFCIAGIFTYVKMFKQAPENTATPSNFNADSAMLAIFGVYNFQNKGVLIPEENTKLWKIKESNELVTTILARTYSEGGVRKGVIAMQRQALSNGEVIDSHGEEATISIYIFRFDGKKWIFEKGKRAVTSAGSYGNAPEGKLIRMGNDKFGLLFEGGFSGQGHLINYAFLIPLSEPKLFDALDLDMGEDNHGTCSDDPKERDDTIEQCWERKSKLVFLKHIGSPYYALKVTTLSSSSDEDEEQTMHSADEFYIYTPAGYKQTKNKAVLSGVVE